MGFGVNTLESLKVGVCFGFISEEALENMEQSLEKCLACDGIRCWQYNFLFIYPNDAVKYFEVAIIMSVAVAVCMMSLWRNQDIFCPMRTVLMAGIKS